MNKRILKPYFSIIIPAHNEEQFLIPLLHSLYWQRFDKQLFEVIIVDNNSTDITRVLAKRSKRLFSELSIRVFTERKVGVSYARNTGGVKAKGSILIFLDADIITSPSLLSSIYQKTKKEHSQAGTIRTLALENSIVGLFIYWTMELIKKYIKRPFGKNFCSKEIFLAVGGYDTNHDRELWHLGTNLDFLIRVKKYLLQKKKKSLAHIKSPIYTSLRRFETKGYFSVLTRWGMVYLGIPLLCRKILQFLSYSRV